MSGACTAGTGAVGEDGGTACPRAEPPARLDALQACLVFDGIEQVQLDDIDLVEDWIAAPHAATAAVPLVVTSQVKPSP